MELQVTRLPGQWPRFKAAFKHLHVKQMDIFVNFALFCGEPKRVFLMGRRVISSRVGGDNNSCFQ